MGHMFLGLSTENALRRPCRHRAPVVLALSLVLGGVTQTLSAAQITFPVINGDPAQEDSWPFMVSLISSGKDETIDMIGCGGTLVHPRFVMTAAHCLFGDFGAVQPGQLEVIAGKTKLSSPNGIRTHVDRVIVHPDYDPDRFVAFPDIALVRLVESIELPTVSLAGPADGHLTTPGTEAIVLGWGISDPDFSSWLVLPDNLQQAKIPILSDDECADTHGLVFHQDAMLCAGVRASGPDARDGVDACYGDSGGPLLVQDGTEWKQVGIVALGPSECVSHKFVGIYTRVSQFSEWLDSTLDVISRARNALGELLPAARKLKRTGSRSARKSVRTLIRELKGLSRSFEAEISETLPNFTAKNVRALVRSVRRARLRKAERLIGEMLQEA